MYYLIYYLLHYLMYYFLTPHWLLGAASEATQRQATAKTAMIRDLILIQDVFQWWLKQKRQTAVLNLQHNSLLLFQNCNFALTDNQCVNIWFWIMHWKDNNMKMFFIFSVPVLIRHLWQLKAVVFLHRCLSRAILLCECLSLPLKSNLYRQGWEHSTVRAGTCGW